jgi:hypothetical protein
MTASRESVKIGANAAVAAGPAIAEETPIATPLLIITGEAAA